MMGNNAYYVNLGIQVEINVNVWMDIIKTNYFKVIPIIKPNVYNAQQNVKLVKNNKFVKLVSMKTNLFKEIVTALIISISILN